MVTPYQSQCPSVAANYGQQCQLPDGHTGDHKAGGTSWPIEQSAAKVIPTLRVSEIFYSLQGEGARAGEPSIFIRLAGCSAKHACYSSGVVCDTEFESGVEMTLTKILVESTLAIARVVPSVVAEVKKATDLWIVFTGGEPLDQVTPDAVQYFKDAGYKLALETSGVKTMEFRMARLFDHITISPKVAEHVLEKNFGHLNLGDQFGTLPHVHELRYVRHAGQPGIPEPRLTAHYYYLSPHSDGAEINQANLQHCIKLCLENPKWRLSVQSHKLWRVL